MADMDATVLTSVIGTLCGVIAVLYRREVARADRLETQLKEAQDFQRNDMTKMLNWYYRATSDYRRIIRGEDLTVAIEQEEGDTTKIIKPVTGKGKKP